MQTELSSYCIEFLKVLQGRCMAKRLYRRESIMIRWSETRTERSPFDYFQARFIIITWPFDEPICVRARAHTQNVIHESMTWSYNHTDAGNHGTYVRTRMHCVTLSVT